MERLFNFSPGPAMLPKEVIEIAKEELMSYKNIGIGPMEFGHRTNEYMTMSTETTKLLKEILGIKKDFEVVMMHGGARTQFAAIPLNFAHNNAAYIVNGLWSQLAFKEAKNITHATAINMQEQRIKDNYDYIHYTPNETVHGIYINKPKASIPIIADATSTLLGIDINISEHDLIYAAAQKNMGIAGVTFVIIKKGLLQQAKPKINTPSILKYQEQVDSKSLFNTPTTFAVYISNLMFKWVKRQGGIKALALRNKERSQKIYQALEQQDIYSGLVEKKIRSPLNICFQLPNQELTNKFLIAAEKRRLAALAGHKAVGGIRASIYNGMPDSGIEALLELIYDFAKNHSRKHTK